MEKSYAVDITISYLEFEQDPNSSATLVTGRNNKVTWNSRMTKRQLKAFSKSPAFGADYIEVRVAIEGDPKGMHRTISCYHGGYNKDIHNDDGTITYLGNDKSWDKLR